MTKRARVIIKRNGGVVVDFDGYTGEECFTEAQDITKHLEGLGVKADVQEVTRKPEADEAPHTEAEAA